MLLGFEPVQEELRLTDAQKKEQEAIVERRVQKIQQVAERQQGPGQVAGGPGRHLQGDRGGDPGESHARAARTAGPDPDPARGAASPSPRPRSGLVAAIGPPLPQRLKLSDDQVRRVRAIAEEGEKEITKAASFAIPLDSKQEPPSMEAIRTLVESPEFQEAKQKARQAGRDASAAVVQRIEEVLTDTQREAYHELRGAPFDLSRLSVEGAERA